MKSIAIDGPTGAGKSTMARELAKRLGFIHVDTGALYRAIGYHMLRRGADIADIGAVRAVLFDLSVEIKYAGGVQRVIINGDDVSDHIRSEDVSMAASAVSAYPEVREFLLGLQRSMANSGNVIMDGRDIGTVVLPKADLKVFLTASKEERARRRYEELKGKGIDADFDTVLKDLSIRDHNDSNRKTAPLTPAEDAVIVDTTGKELCASVETLYTLVKEKLDL